MIKGVYEGGFEAGEETWIRHLPGPCHYKLTCVVYLCRRWPVVVFPLSLDLRSLKKGVLVHLDLNAFLFYLFCTLTIFATSPLKKGILVHLDLNTFLFVPVLYLYYACTF